MHVILMFIMTIVIAVPAWAFTTDGQEDICASAAVIFCDNFENRATGTADLGRAIFKNTGWKVYYQPTFVTTAEHFDGSKSIAVPYPSGNNVGGVYTIAILPSGHQDIYVRWYVKYSSNFVWSNQGGKHMKTGITSDQNAIHLYSRLFGDEVMRDAYGVTPPWYTYTAPNTVDNIILFQQKNNFRSSNLFGQWFCLEAHVKVNSTLTQSSTADGVVEGWFNGLPNMSYTGLNLDAISPTGSARDWTVLYIDGYWNCDSGENPNVPGQCNGTGTGDTHPAMTRWHDNIVVSTQRIGCLGSPASSDTSPPTAPGNLQISSLWDWLLSMFGTIFSG